MCKHTLMVESSGTIPKDWQGCKRGAIIALCPTYYFVEVQAPDTYNSADVLGVFAMFGAMGCVKAGGASCIA